MQLKVGKNKTVDLRLCILKPLGVECLNLMHKYIHDNPTIVKNGFKAAGILECLKPIVT